MNQSERRPRVLIDCTAIPAERRGVGRYVEGLLGGLGAESRPADEIELFVVCQQRDLAALRADAPWAQRILALPSLLRYRPLRLAWEQLGLPVLARRLRVEVIHSPHYTFPIAWGGARVVTLHDATFFSDPGAHTAVKRRFFRWWTRRAWKRADVVVTPSAASAGEIERFIGRPHGTVEVAHLGVDSGRFHRPSAEASRDFRAAHALAPTQRWFAFLGTIEPRKSVPALLDGYRWLREQLGADTPLLLVSGGRGWDSTANAMLDSLPAGSGVVELGYLPAAHLSALLGDSLAVLYPTLGEGFGLPVLEAMACGAPVLTTNRLAIPEVGGDAVLYVEPTADAIGPAMLSLTTDAARRSDLARRGLARAAAFTWAATARAHVEAYRHAARD
jgi:glycosyltransferase involved in cell wall biosynthesis